MGATRTTTENSQSTTTPKYSPGEEASIQLQLDREKYLDPQIRQVQSSGLDLVSKLLAGGSLPGYLNKLPGGISPEVTQGIVDQSLKDVNSNLAASGVGSIMESGVAQKIATKTAAGVRQSAEEFNLGNLLNLLNLATGSSAQIQAPIMQQSAILSQRLAGLRSVEQTGSSTSRFKFNPFNESFQSSAGSGLGNIFNPQTWYKPCWVAAEVFGGWNKLKTRFARAYVMLQAPKWFRDFYIQHGQKLAAFIHDKPALKAIIRPLFEYFAIKGGYSGR